MRFYRALYQGRNTALPAYAPKLRELHNPTDAELSDAIAWLMREGRS
jgi:hypothetical protein